MDDLLIIGAGPTGLFAAFCAGMREMRVRVVERLPEPGGQLAVLYPEKYIYDAPGYAKILARELASQLYQQSHTFGTPVYCFEEQAKTLSWDGDAFALGTDKGTHYARAVLVAAGIGSFVPNKVAVRGAEEGKPGIYYFVKSLDVFVGKRVLVVGGGDSAADWALAIHDIAKSVTVVHRTDRFRAHEASVRRMMETVDVRTFHELKAVHGEARVEGATIFDNRTGTENTIPVDAVVFALGFKADLGDLRQWRMEMDEPNRHIKVDPTMATSRAGVFAAGDITEVAYLQQQELPEDQRQYDGTHLSIPSPKYVERKERWGLIVTGYAQAAVAVNFAKRHITPTASLSPGHSSAMR